MFAVNSFLKVWSVDNSRFDADFLSCKASTSYKHFGANGGYVVDFSAFVNIRINPFVSLNANDLIVIDECAVANKYNKEKGITYTNYYVTKWHKYTKDVFASADDSTSFDNIDLS